MRLFEVACNIIAEEGTLRVFGLMGDGNMNMITYMSGSLGLHFDSSRHESGAIGMADGYSRASGNVGVCTVTQGPGLTNAITALITARKARSPLVLLVGDVTAAQTGWPQDADQEALLAAAGVPVIQLSNPRTAHGDVREAFRLARSRSIPVALNCANDAQLREWEPWDVDVERSDDVVIPTPTVPEADIAEVVNLLVSARRPVILAGRGALRSGSAAALRELGARIGALMATTLPGKALFETDPFDIGVVGSLGTNLANSLANRADVVLAVGASLNDFTSLKGSLFGEGAKVIRCDEVDDPSPNRYGAHRLLVGDARAVVEQLNEALPSPGHLGPKYRTDEVTEQLREYDPDHDFVDQSEPRAMDPRSLMVALNGLLPEDRQVVTDVGHFFGFPATYLRCREGGRYFPAVEFGAVGSGLGVAIGASLARPELTTVLVVGDGGLMMSLPDLDTAARAKAPIVIVVMNDGAYGSELQMLRNWRLSEDAAVFENPSFELVGRSLGVNAWSANSVSDLGRLKTLDLPVEGPVLLDCHITQKVVAPWLQGAFEH